MSDPPDDATDSGPAVASVDDVTLLAAWRDGDKAAGAALFERHFSSIYRFFRNKTPAGVDDLVQQTFLALLESPGGFRGEGSFRGFLYGIARNKLYAYLRAKRRTNERLDFTSMSFADLGTSPTQALAREDHRRQLSAALQRLPVEQQLLLELSYWEELSPAEIAESFDIPLDTAYTRLRRAKEHLRKAYTQLGITGSKRGLQDASEDQLTGWLASMR